MKELIFNRYRKYNTDDCQNLHLSEMQLAIINDPYFIFLSNDSTENLSRICEECSDFEPIWLSIDKYF